MYPAEEVHCSPRHSVRHAVDRVAEHAGSHLVIIIIISVITIIITIIIIIIEQQLTRAMQASMSANVTRTCSLKVAFSMVEGSRLAKYVLMGPMISSMARLQAPPRSSSIQSEAQSVSSCYVHHCPCPKLPVLVYVSRLDLPNQFRRTVPPSRNVRALASLHTAWRL